MARGWGVKYLLVAVFFCVVLLLAGTLADLNTLPQAPAPTGQERYDQQADGANEPGDQGQGTTGVAGSGKERDASLAGETSEMAIRRSSNSNLSLEAEQKQRVREFFNRAKDQESIVADFAISVGALIPRNVQLKDINPELKSIIPQHGNAQYIVVRNDFVLVDPQTRRVVAIMIDVA